MLLAGRQRADGRLGADEDRLRDALVAEDDRRLQDADVIGVGERHLEVAGGRIGANLLSEWVGHKEEARSQKPESRIQNVEDSGP